MIDNLIVLNLQMDQHVQVVEFIDDEEILKKKRKKQSLRARYVYGFVFFATNILAWVLRDYGNIVLDELHCKFSCLFCRFFWFVLLMFS